MKMKDEIIILPRKKIVVGMASRKGITQEMLQTELESVLRRNRLYLDSICAFACIKNRYNEMGIRRLAKKLGIPIFFYSLTDLEKGRDEYDGHGGKRYSVCAYTVIASCMKISEFYRFLFEKREENGIIISIAVIWEKKLLA